MTIKPLLKFRFLFSIIFNQFKLKLLFKSIFLIFIFGCKNLPTIDTKRNLNPKESSSTSNHSDSLPDDDYEDSNTSQPIKSDKDSDSNISSSDFTGPSTNNEGGYKPAIHEPQIGIIIGPGFLRSYLAAGVLLEFHRSRIPIKAIVGFEWGSLPGALYSLNGEANEVEWQMLKINESSVLKKSLIRSQFEPQNLKELNEYLKITFNNQSFEKTKINFECLSFDYKRHQYYWMKKGALSAALPYCLASPPFYTPYLNNVSALDLKLAVNSLRQKGANYIIFIDTLGNKSNLLDNGFSSEAQVLWSLYQTQLLKSKSLVDFIIDTSSAPYSLLDFNSRRDMIRKGQEFGQSAVKKLSAKLKL